MYNIMKKVIKQYALIEISTKNVSKFMLYRQTKNNFEAFKK